MKKSVQLYSIRLLCEQDLEKGLKTVSEMGYDGVEFAGFFNNSAETVKGWLQKYNLVAQGAHVGSDLIFDKTDETIAYHKEIGNTRIICPWHELNNEADVIAFTQKIKEVAPKFKENGMKLYYHNHADEFEKDNGKYLIDIMAENTAKDELWMEFDVYWVFRGGECPVKYLQKYSDRTDIFHAKDGDMENGTAVGQGQVNFPEIFEAAKAQNIEWVVVEAEAGETVQAQIDDVKASIEYIKTLI